MASEAGKGDSVRPTDYKKYSENYDAIFGKKPKVKTEIEILTEEARELVNEGNNIIIKAILNEKTLKTICKEIK